MKCLLVYQYFRGLLIALFLVTLGTINSIPWVGVMINNQTDDTITVGDPEGTPICVYTKNGTDWVWVDYTDNYAPLAVETCSDSDCYSEWGYAQFDEGLGTPCTSSDNAVKCFTVPVLYSNSYTTIGYLTFTTTKSSYWQDVTNVQCFADNPNTNTCTSNSQTNCHSYFNGFDVNIELYTNSDGDQIWPANMPGDEHLTTCYILTVTDSNDSTKKKEKADAGKKPVIIKTTTQDQH